MDYKYFWDVGAKYFWYAAAAISGGYVFQVSRPDGLPFWHRVSHLVAGATCAVYFSPFAIGYFELGNTDGQYLIPFTIGAFWWKFFEALESSVGGLRFPWSK